MLVFVGRANDPRKNVGLLLDALPLLPGVRALLVGEPPDTPLPERAQATGVVPSIAPFLRRGTMLVLPSHQEGFGIVGAEAMAAGLPVVTTPSGGPEALVRDSRRRRRALRASRRRSSPTGCGHCSTTRPGSRTCAGRDVSTSPVSIRRSGSGTARRRHSRDRHLAAHARSVDCRRHARPTPASSCGRSPSTATLDYRVYVSEIAPEAGGDLRTVVVPEFPASRSRLGRVAGLTRATVADGRLRRALDRDHAAAFHFPLTVMLPRVGAPATTTIHDLQHEAYPQFFSRPQLSYRRHVYGRSVKASRIVITVSEHVRDDLVERLGYPRERVRVIHHGVDHERFTPDGREREPFLLYPANWWPHKNHELLLEAFASVRRERPELRLVLTGSDHPAALPDGVDVARPGVRRAARRALPERRRARLPEPLRGLRAAAAGGDGVRRARSPSRGWRRSPRSAATPPSTSTRPRRRPSRRGSSRCSTGRLRAAPSGPLGSPGRSSRTATTPCTVSWPAAGRAG